MQKQTLNAFNGIPPNTLSSQPVKVAKGAYSIPVEINSAAKINDPTLANYETPSFIHKSEKQIPNEQYDINSYATHPSSPLAINQLPRYDGSSSIAEAVNNDITSFSHELSNNLRSAGEKAGISNIYI